MIPLYLLSMCLQAPLDCEFLRLPLFLVTMTILGRTGQDFVERLDVFLLVRLDRVFW